MAGTAVYQLQNLPRRTADGGLSNRIEGTGIRGNYVEITCGGWLCCEQILVGGNAEQIMVTFARIIELAMDAGFERGRAYVRKALGAKEG